ncbi:MAG: hypothetical protein ABIG89_03595 [Candidatus Woesearchaeota archaeon]
MSDKNLVERVDNTNVNGGLMNKMRDIGRNVGKNVTAYLTVAALAVGTAAIVGGCGDDSSDYEWGYENGKQVCYQKVCTDWKTTHAKGEQFETCVRYDKVVVEDYHCE